MYYTVLHQDKAKKKTPKRSLFHKMKQFLVDTNQFHIKMERGIRWDYTPNRLVSVG